MYIKKKKNTTNIKNEKKNIKQHGFVQFKWHDLEGQAIFGKIFKPRGCLLVPFEAVGGQKGSFGASSQGKGVCVCVFFEGMP